MMEVFNPTRQAGSVKPMPRTGPRRVMIGVKLLPAAIAYIDELAEAEGVNRSEMVRRLLAEAVAARRKG